MVLESLTIITPCSAVSPALIASIKELYSKKLIFQFDTIVSVFNQPTGLKFYIFNISTDEINFFVAV